VPVTPMAMEVTPAAMVRFTFATTPFGMTLAFMPDAMHRYEPEPPAQVTVLLAASAAAPDVAEIYVTLLAGYVKVHCSAASAPVAEANVRLKATVPSAAATPEDNDRVSVWPNDGWFANRKRIARVGKIGLLYDLLISPYPRSGARLPIHPCAELEILKQSSKFEKAVSFPGRILARCTRKVAAGSSSLLAGARRTGAPSSLVGMVRHSIPINSTGRRRRHIILVVVCENLTAWVVHRAEDRKPGQDVSLCTHNQLITRVPDDGNRKQA